MTAVKKKIHGAPRMSGHVSSLAVNATATARKAIPYPRSPAWGGLVVIRLPVPPRLVWALVLRSPAPDGGESEGPHCPSRSPDLQWVERKRGFSAHLRPSRASSSAARRVCGPLKPRPRPSDRTRNRPGPSGSVASHCARQTWHRSGSQAVPEKPDEQYDEREDDESAVSVLFPKAEN